MKRLTFTRILFIAGGYELSLAIHQFMKEEYAMGAFALVASAAAFYMGLKYITKGEE